MRLISFILLSDFWPLEGVFSLTPECGRHLPQSRNTNFSNVHKKWFGNINLTNLDSLISNLLSFFSFRLRIGLCLRISAPFFLAYLFENLVIFFSLIINAVCFLYFIALFYLLLSFNTSGPIGTFLLFWQQILRQISMVPNLVQVVPCVGRES